MMEEIAPRVWKLNVDSNVYFLDLKEKIVIDTGPRAYRDLVERELKNAVGLENVNRVLFTHLHYDHIGNYDLFPNARFYASKGEISLLNKNRMYAIGDPVLAEEFKAKLNELRDFSGLKIIDTPGHTKGSVCIYYEKEKVLFSGDTLFFNGFGRVDFPFSDPGKMEGSLEKIGKIGYKILAPGHDY
ncbi:MBL fold metallo-hydrolase [Candidatus Woesearchaeota archaeon]|nr:MBL fold metallo-hydrolase [Candidatus Woesearchaeota archaeon]